MPSEIASPALPVADAARILVSNEATAGAYAVWMQTVAPNGGPGRHIHENEDEVFQVLAGRLLVWCDGQTYEAGPGDTRALPRGVAHAFRVISDHPARLLRTVVPGGFEQIHAVEDLRPSEDEPRLRQLGGRYGIRYVDPPPGG